MRLRLIPLLIVLRLLALKRLQEFGDFFLGAILEICDDLLCFFWSEVSYGGRGVRLSLHCAWPITFLALGWILAWALCVQISSSDFVTKSERLLFVVKISC